MRIAYAVQNVGINLKVDIGDAVPVKYTLRGLQRNGHEVTCLFLSDRSVLGFDDVSNLDNYWSAQLGLTGKRPFMFIESGVRRVQSTLGLPYLALFDSYRFYEACYRCLPRYDLCHEHNGYFSVGAALACSRLKIPYVLTVSAPPLIELDLMGNPYHGLQKRVAQWEAKWTYQQARRIICVSQSSKQQLIEDWQVDANKIIVMPNGVDIDLFGSSHDPKPIQAEFGINSNPVVGFVGAFHKWHGIDLLLESFAHVLCEIPEAKLFLVGDGPARLDIEQKIADLDIRSAVIITGLIPQKRVPEMLAAIDVAVLPYPRLPKELWFSPLKLYEYMAASKAIVASRAGQIADVIQDGYDGLLVESGNIEDLAQSMIRLLINLEERQWLGRNARKKVVERHSWKQYIKRLEHVYQSVL